MNGLAFRYGIEVEGPFKGEMTLIVPTAAWHTVSIVEAAIRRHHATRPTHLWVEVQADERFDWAAVETLLQAGFKVTAQVREAEDTPPAALLENERFGIVWMVPARFRDLLLAAEYVKWAVAPGDGMEAALNFRTFDPAEYEKDQIWQR